MTDYSAKEDKLNELMVDKSVKSVEYWDTGMTIYFTDGTEINVRSSGNGDVWLTVDEV